MQSQFGRIPGRSENHQCIRNLKILLLIIDMSGRQKLARILEM